MPAVYTTVKELLSGSFELIGMFSEDDPLSNTYLTKALRILNSVLDEFSSNPSKIAYDKTLTFPIIAGKQSYTFSKAVGADVDSERIVSLKILNIIDGNNIYPVRIKPDTYYFDNFRTVTGGYIPNQAFIQNANDSSTITFFTVPPYDITGELKGKFDLSHVDLNDILNTVPNYFIEFLTYQVAQRLNHRFDGTSWTADKANTLAKYKKNIIAASDMNMNINTNGTLNEQKYDDSTRIFRGY